MVGDTSGCVDTTRDDSTWRTLEVTSSLGDDIDGEIAVEIV